MKTILKILGILTLIAVALIFAFALWIQRSKANIDIRSMQFTTMDGVLMSLDQLTGDKYTILNFWATWCRPCIEEMPLLEALQAEMDTVVWQLFLVSDEPKETIENFITRRNITLSNLRLEGDRETHGIGALPRTLVLDREGTIVYDKLGAIQMDVGRLHERLSRILKRM